MRTSRRTALTAALVAAVLGVPAGGGHGAAASAESLEQLQAALTAATGRTVELGAALEHQAARDGGLRVALERLEQQHEAAQARLDARVRAVWISRRPDPLSGWVQGASAPALRHLASRGAAASVSVDRELIDAVADQSDAARQLRAQAAQFQEQLLGQADAALAAQDRARALLADAERLLAAQQAAAAQAAGARAAAAHVAGARAAAAQAAAAIAEQTRLAAAQNQLTTVRSTLDSASATVTSALTPAQTRRSLAARAGEAPLLTLVEAAGSGYPQGYAASGSLLTGLASWYGPGFVGSPTASGTPYDPERLTCAHKTLPLRTVLRVSANGRSVSCLVNDRGPYVGPRILDLSRAGSRALGFDGVQQVTIEILAPAPPSP